MRMLLKAALLAATLAAIATSSAAATTSPAMFAQRSPVGTASNTGALSGNASSYPAHTFSAGGGGWLVSCADTAVTVTPVTTTTATLSSTYSGCVLSISGTVLSTVTIDWLKVLSIANSVLDLATKAWNLGKAIFSRPGTIQAPGIGCIYDITAPQTLTGFSGQNISAAGTADTSASPWGSKIVAAVTGLTLTATTTPGGNCVSPEHFSAAYSGTIAVHNVWGAP